MELPFKYSFISTLFLPGTCISVTFRSSAAGSHDEAVPLCPFPLPCRQLCRGLFVNRGSALQSFICLISKEGIGSRPRDQKRAYHPLYGSSGSLSKSLYARPPWISWAHRWPSCLILRSRLSGCRGAILQRVGQKLRRPCTAS